MSKTSSSFIIRGRVGKGVYHNTSPSGTKTTKFNVGFVTGKDKQGNCMWENVPMSAFGHRDLIVGRYYIFTGRVGARRADDKGQAVYLLADSMALQLDEEGDRNGTQTPPMPDTDGENFYSGNATYNNNFDAGMNNAPDDTDIPF